MYHDCSHERLCAKCILKVRNRESRPSSSVEPRCVTADVNIVEEEQNMASLRKLRTNLGHPSNHVLPRARRVTGGSAAAVRAALQLRCDACESQHHPGPHLPARLRTDREFG